MDDANQQQSQAVEEQKSPPVRFLSMEERNDLRKRVLAGEQLTVDEARAVFETLRSGQGGVVITGETTRKKSRKKKEGMSDEALEASLDKFL